MCAAANAVYARYFMTIPEAARLVLQAAAIGETGQVRVLDMGEPDRVGSFTHCQGLPVMRLTHLQRLEAESIHILREVVAECGRPVMLYSIGKDSATMLHLARKAFYPAPPPFPLLHVVSDGAKPTLNAGEVSDFRLTCRHAARRTQGPCGRTIPPPKRSRG